MHNIESQHLAKKIRQHVINMVYQSKSSHIGSCYSIADILAVLYTDILKVDPKNPCAKDRDRFILSKGHAAAVLYAILAERQFFPTSWLQSYNHHGAKLLGHCTAGKVPGVEVSTGSLGHGLPIAIGMAQAIKIDKISSNVYVLLGDGECNEGSIWEAALLAAQLQLDNLTVIIDYNKIQSFGNVKDVINLEPLAAKWHSFGWQAIEINGHNHTEINNTLKSDAQNNKPKVIIAHTIKGKGVSFMEDKLAWHYKSPNAQELENALAELEV